MYRYNPTLGFIYLGIGFVILFIMFLAFKGVLRKCEDQSWMEDKLEEMNIPGKFIIGNSPVRDVLVYSSEECVYVVNKINKSVKQVRKEDILDIDLDIYVTERNVKRLVALTSTFDKRGTISSIIFRITTKEKTYEFDCYYNGNDGMGKYVHNVYDIVNDLKRYKLVLESEIKQLNNTNI